MRLLNIYSLQFKDFFLRDLPDYFILSHRWEGDEISYKDFSKGRGEGTRGYQKIFCEFARRHANSLGSYGDPVQIQWVWMDTCMRRSYLQESEY